MRIYTRGGDEGQTGLFGGARVGKDAPRIAAYGEIDELNSVLGWCAVPAAGTEIARLHRVQSLLFSIGSWLATPADASASTRSHLPAWPEQAIPELESEIDAWEEALDPLANFILPGGNELASRLHVARSVCRRAERAVTALAQLEQDAVVAEHLAYLNRLSDWLFVFARYANKVAGETDVPWTAASAVPKDES
ncbi:MAG: cob(I)yrinic acid a,c-diamide adenosyltransferase [Planctomycetota bacterium]